MANTENLRRRLLEGLVIPACPLALDSSRRFDPRRQRALLRYYRASGAGGIAVGVHTTQFSIRNPKFGLFRPVLELAAREIREGSMVGIAGACGPTSQAVRETSLAQELGYHAVLLSLGHLRNEDDATLITHCREVAAILPLVGFYLQPKAGGRVLTHRFWRKFVEIPEVVAIKIAPFNRYQTIDVIRAVSESGRNHIALYTGNDDHILLDLLTPFRFHGPGGPNEIRIVGGLLGQWAVWTRRAMDLHARCLDLAQSGSDIPSSILREANELTDANAAIFDAANDFAGCIPGIHEILRRQGLLEGIWCLDSTEVLSPGQKEEIDRVCKAYPHLTDDDFVHQNIDRWLS